MSENKQPSGIAQAWGNPKAKKGMIVFAILVVAILGVSFAMGNRTKVQNTGPAPTAKVVEPPSGVADPTAATGESYRGLVRAADVERAERARDSSSTAMVLPSVAGIANADDAKRAAMMEAGRQRALEQAQAQTRIQTAADAAGMATQDPNAGMRQTDTYRTALTFMQRIAAREDAQVAPLVVVTPPEAKSGSGDASNQSTGGAIAQSTPRGGAAVAQGSGGSTSQGQGKPLVRAGEIVFAVTDVATNSDFSGPVSVTIRQGKFNGARLIGEKSLENEAVVVRFQSMSPADGGPVFPVQAYAISLGDAKTYGTTGLTGDTDYHFFERYVLPGAASFLQAYGMSASQKGTTAIVTQNGVATETPGLTEKDRLTVAAGASMSPIVADIQKRASRPVTVSMPAGTEIGVLFASDVFSPQEQRSNAAAPATVSSTTAIPQRQSTVTNEQVAVIQAQQSAAAANARANDAMRQVMQQAQSPAYTSPYAIQGVSTPYGGTAYGATNPYGMR